MNDLVRVATEFAKRVQSTASRHQEDMSALIAGADEERLIDAVIITAVGWCRVTNNRRFADAMLEEADKLEVEALRSETSKKPLMIAADRVRQLAAAAPKSGRGRPYGDLSSSAGQILQAVEDAHMATAHATDLDHFLAPGIAGKNALDIGCRKGAVGQPSTGAASLKAALADDVRAAGISEIDFAKAARNARGRLKRRKISANPNI